MKKILVLSLAAVAGSSFAQVWSGAGGAIPDATTTTAGTISTTIVAPALTSISAVAILGLTHSWSGDLVCTVTNPSAVTVNMFVRIGRTTANAIGSPFGRADDFAGTYVFGAGGANIWTTVGNPIPGGGYMSSDGLSGAGNGFFAGPQAAGTWTITISDWGGGDTGAFQGWEIRGEAVPEPATMAALGLGAVALIRRRRK